MIVSTENAEHYIWGGICDGWCLLNRDDMSVIRERVPASGAEVMHYHEKARQFFYVLEGEGQMVFEDHEIILQKGQGLEISPMLKHQFKNGSQADVHFLVISVPSTRGDRILALRSPGVIPGSGGTDPEPDKGFCPADDTCPGGRCQGAPGSGEG